MPNRDSRGVVCCRPSTWHPFRVVGTRPSRARTLRAPVEWRRVKAVDSGAAAVSGVCLFDWVAGAVRGAAFRIQSWGGWYTIFIWYTMLAVIGYGHEEWVRIGVGAGHEATPRRDHRRTAATRQQARGARSRRRARRQSGAGARRAANTRDRGTGYPQ